MLEKELGCFKAKKRNQAIVNAKVFYSERKIYSSLIKKTCKAQQNSLKKEKNFPPQVPNVKSLYLYNNRVWQKMIKKITH